MPHVSKTEDLAISKWFVEIKFTNYQVMQPQNSADIPYIHL